METGATFELSIAGSVATLVFKREGGQPVNVVDLKMLSALIVELDALAARDDVRCLVLRGAGKGFLAGGDLAYLHADMTRAPENARATIEALNEVMRRLVRLPMATLASVHGAAAGVGNSFAMACDMVIASDDARFIYAYDKIATTPDGGLSWLLPRKVGLARAMEIGLFGEPLSATRAQELGLVSRIVKVEELDAATQELATRLAALPTRAVVSLRDLLRDGLQRNFDEHLDFERDAFGASAATQDFKEGVDAFYERRPAVMHGK